MISKDRIQEILKKKGIKVDKITTDPRIFEMACNAAYKAIPIPLRWFVGKKRVRKILEKLREQISQANLGKASSPRAPSSVRRIAR